MKMKQFFCILLTLCMVLGMVPVTVLAEESDEIVLNLDIQLDDLQARHDVPTLDAPEDSIWIEGDEFMCFEDAYDDLLPLSGATLLTPVRMRCWTRRDGWRRICWLMP